MRARRKSSISSSLNDALYSASFSSKAFSFSSCTVLDGEEKVDHFTGHPGSGAEMTRRIMRRMRFDNDSIRKVSSLVRWHDERPADNERSVRRAMVKIGDEAFPNLFELKRADTMGQSNYMREEKLAAIDMFERRYREIREKKQALTVKDLAVDGEDLMRLGIAKGPELGKTLKALLEKVLDQPELNEKDKLLDLVQKMRRNAGGLLLLMVCFTFLMMNVAVTRNLAVTVVVTAISTVIFFFSKSPVYQIISTRIYASDEEKDTNPL